MSVQLATPEEAASLAHIHARVFPGRGWDEAFFLRACGNLVDVVLIEGEPPSGLAVLRIAPGEAELLTIGVIRPREGRGTRLLRAAMAAAAARGAESLFLEVSRANKAALALYGRCGFFEVGTRRGYYENGEDAAVLRCDLSGGLPHAPSGEDLR